MVNWRSIGGRSDALAVASLVLLASVLAVYLDPHRPMAATMSDGDILHVMQGLRVNDDLPQTHGAHGFFLNLCLGLWYRLLELFRFLPATGSNDIFGARRTLADFAELLTAARYFMAVLAAVLSLAVYFIVRHVTERRWLAALAACAILVSWGSQFHFLVVRTELPSITFCALAVLVLVAFAVRRTGWRAVSAVGAATFLAMLSVMSKVHAIPLALAMPIIALAFGQRLATPGYDAVAPWDRPLRIAFCAGTTAFAVPAAAMLGITVLQAQGNGAYQFAVVAYLVAAVLAYGRVYRVPALDTTMSLAVMAAATAAALYIHLLTPSHSYFLDAIANFVDFLVTFAPAYANEGLEISYSKVFERLPALVGATFRKFFLPESPWQFPFFAVFWVALLGSLHAMATGRFGVAMRSGTFLAIAVGMATFTGLRGHSIWYFIYWDLWGALAVAVLIDAYAPRAPAPDSATIRSSRNVVPLSAQPRPFST